MYKWRNLNNKRHEIYSYFIMETIQKSELLIYLCWIWELLTECFHAAFQNNFKSYKNSASNYQSVLLDMMVACAYMNSETLFFECFRECIFHTFCMYDNLRYRFNALWCWIFVTVKISLKSGVETFSQKFWYSAKIY
jgi:hypothetical protein